ncbi:GIY-YIG nuclease family protein [Thomasclavelia saccharogumia]|uniref:GIY-YIG nuclease family protein n=1 Tax=Thomasclavelia saccharogumia TaxID=341225 RepID=UPI000479B105|nr:GIY-YIG nuclease family protein [Thomasclavelia saccharogumia]
MKNYVYIIKCADNTYYTGWTTNIEKRIIVHNSGKGAKYTKSRRPVNLVYFEELENKSLALKREHAIKQLTRKQKEDLIKLAKANK